MPTYEATIGEPVLTTTSSSSVPPDTVPPHSPPPQPETSSNPGVLITQRGVVVAVLEELPEGFRVRTPCGETAVVTEGTRIREATVVLDPGHGGGEPGAVSPDGLPEDGINLAIAQRTKATLEAAGVSVVLTRTGDYDVTLESRAQIVRSLEPKAFVSLHHNAEPDGPSAKPGTETYYQIASPESKRLSGLIYEEVVGALSAYDVAWVADFDAGAKYREGRQGDYYAVLRLPGPVTSVLSEAAFISNPEEAALLTRPDVQAAEADAVARGLLRYLTTSDSGSGFVTPYPRPSPPPSPSPVPPRPCRDPVF